MSLVAGTAQCAEIVVFSTISCKEALIELVPEFERASGHKVNITYAGGIGPLQPDPQSTQREAAQVFVSFLRSKAAHAVLRRKGLDPA